MTEAMGHEVRKPKWNWPTRVEHIVEPGRLVPGHHFRHCGCRCQETDLCPTCGKVTFITYVKGRWDPEVAATALPFDPVWLSLSCGCVFGDESAARPVVKEAVSEPTGAGAYAEDDYGLTWLRADDDDLPWRCLETGEWDDWEGLSVSSEDQIKFRGVEQ